MKNLHHFVDESPTTEEGGVKMPVFEASSVSTVDEAVLTFIRGLIDPTLPTAIYFFQTHDTKGAANDGAVPIQSFELRHEYGQRETFEYHCPQPGMYFAHGIYWCLSLTQLQKTIAQAGLHVKLEGNVNSIPLTDLVASDPQ